MKILDATQIQQKIVRLAMEIHEHNLSERNIVLAGINNNGVRFAKLVHKELTRLTSAQLVLTQISLNPANPLGNPIEIKLPADELRNKVIVVIDDVANTGRTLFYAFKPLLDVLPKKVEAAVLVDRQHKSFPVEVDYVGLSLATTMNENIDVDITARNRYAVYLN